jgi:hypothetical protein
MSDKLSAEQMARLSAYNFNKTLYKEQANSKGYITSTLYEVEEKIYEKFCKYFSGENVQNNVTSFNKKDKVYVVSNHPLPLYKIKEAVKSKGGVITNDVSKATKILGHSCINERVQNSQNQAKLSSLMINIDNRQTYIDYNELDYRVEPEDYVNDESVDQNSCLTLLQNRYNIKISDLANRVPIIISGKIISKEGRLVGCSGHSDEKFYVRDEFVKILFYALSNKVPIISPTDFINSCTNQDSLTDPNVFDSIFNMLSGNSSDKVIGESLLCNVNTTGAIDELYQLAQSFSYLRYVHNKEVKFFVQSTPFSKLCMLYDSSSFLIYCIENELLTKKIFNKYINECREELVQSLPNNPFFDIKINLNNEYSSYKLDNKEYSHTKSINDDG